MLMTTSFGIGGFVMVLAENLAEPLAVTAQLTASISDGLRCYFPPPLQEAEDFCGLHQTPWLFSADYQPDQPGLALWKA